MVSSILLAAGESKRMGKPKQLLPWRQGTMVEQTIDNLLGSAVNEVIVVVGHRAEEVIKAIATKAVKLAVNPDYKQGMSTSIIVGLNFQPARAERVTRLYLMSNIKRNYWG